MSRWPSTRASRVLAALKRKGWVVARTAGSHRTLKHPDYPRPVTFAFHDSEEIGPPMMAKLGKETGLEPSDL